MDGTEQQIEFLKEKLSILREQMPETPLDAERKAMEIGLIEEQLAELYEQSGRTVAAVQAPGLDGLTEEISSINDELMGLEIRMLKAEMSGDDGERTKLQMCTDTLKARRQALIDEVRSRNVRPSEPEKESLESRVEALEREVADLKALLYQILTRRCHGSSGGRISGIRRRGQRRIPLLHQSDLRREPMRNEGAHRGRHGQDPLHG